ncbi:MAG: hypothetical protein RLZZ510_675 [Bacteroidota bacterium]
MGLTALTVISVGVYLWYNFNARSRLVLVVPSTAQWFFHVQTKLLRGDFSGSTKAPEGIDLLRRTVSKLPIFQGVKDAGEPGIALYSDVVSFGMQEGQFLALSITSEERFKSFMQSLKKRNMLKGGIDKGRYFYAEFPSGKAFVAFKYKALVIFKPSDSISDYHVAEKAFDQVFAEKTHTLMQNPAVQALYEGEPEVVFYSTAPAFGLSQSIDFPAVNDQQAANSFVKFAYPGKKGNTPVSPLMLVAKVGYPAQLELCIDKENRMTAHTALDLMAKILDLKIREIAK